MRFWPRLRGLLLSPRETWAAIAAEPAPSLARALPLVLLPWLVIGIYAALGGEPLLPAQQVEPFMMQRPDGTLVQIGTRVTTRGGALLIAIGGAVSTAIWLFLQRGMILRSAARYLAIPDGDAALKLTLYAPITLWIAVSLPSLGSLLAFPAMIHMVILAYLGAPILLPPHPGQEAGFSRSIAFRTVLLGIATTVAWMAAWIWLVGMVAS
ncbi:hypothetical protein ACVFYP_26830 [Roseomonas sp. F4]